MFERYTERARKVIVLAQEEARDFNHNYVGTEHLLLGLLREEEGLAAGVLMDCGVTLEFAREQVRSISGFGGGASTNITHAPFTPRSKKVLEFALREALHFGHNYIGTEHILLALTRESEGRGARVLDRAPHAPNRAAIRAQALNRIKTRNLKRGQPKPYSLERILEDDMADIEWSEPLEGGVEYFLSPYRVRAGGAYAMLSRAKEVEGLDREGYIKQYADDVWELCKHIEDLHKRCSVLEAALRDIDDSGIIKLPQGIRTALYASRPAK